MLRITFFVAIGIVVIHGLIHLMGFVAYWPLAEIAELPYKTTLLNGRFPVSEMGMRLFSVLWLAAAIGLVSASIGALTGQSWWFPLMWAGGSPVAAGVCAGLETMRSEALWLTW